MPPVSSALPVPMTDAEWIDALPEGLGVAERRRLRARRARWARHFVLQPRVLLGVAEEGRAVLAATGSHAEMFEQLQRSLCRRYPGQIDSRPLHWMRNQAGGAVGDIAFLGISRHEYVVFFHAPVVPGPARFSLAHGFSGRYRSLDMYDFLLDGRIHKRRPGDMDANAWQTQEPGEVTYLGAGDAWEYASEGVVLMEYARGRMAADALWYGQLQSFLFLSNDRRGTWEQLSTAARLYLTRSHA